MTRIISMAYTAPAILARRKTVTRRDWDTRYAQTFHGGQRVQAYDKSPRFGGKRIAVIELTQDPYREPLHLMPAADYEAEGFAYLHQAGIQAPPTSGFTDFSWADFDRWRASGAVVWVVRFKIVSVEGGDHE